MQKLNFIIIIFSILFSHTSFAEDDLQREKSLFRQVRCATCYGQSIDESNTEQAIIIKDYIRKKIIEGESDEQILAGIRAEYGDFLVFRPSFNLDTLMLWVLPAAILLLLIQIIRKKIKLS